MRRASNIDTNQPLIVKALRAVGATVEHLHSVGKGCPDLLVGYRRQSFLLEVKDPAKPPSHRSLNEAQVTWHRLWNGLPVVVVLTPEEALKAIGAVK